MPTNVDSFVLAVLDNCSYSPVQLMNHNLSANVGEFFPPLPEIQFNAWKGGNQYYWGKKQTKGLRAYFLVTFCFSQTLRILKTVDLAGKVSFTKKTRLPKIVGRSNKASISLVATLVKFVWACAVLKGCRWFLKGKNMIRHLPKKESICRKRNVTKKIRPKFAILLDQDHGWQYIHSEQNKRYRR